MDSQTQHGYLVLADISGYTSFLAGVELDHAHEILTALLETIVNRFRGLLTISKLEGDAVFGYAAEAAVPRGETLLELIECTYVAFRDHVEAAHRRTTCQCNACRAIPTLDLKFMVHHGDYIVQQVAGIHELVGSDVNLVHRLMKNHIFEATGWKAYALFTDLGLAHMGVRPEGMHQQPETYEHLGEVQTFSVDMRRRYAEIKETQRVFIAAEQADAILQHDFPAPPPAMWDWVNEPFKRVQWAGFDELQWFRRPDGRTGAGARSHCVHNKQVLNAETVLDWRPFDYFTLDTSSGLVQTFQFEPRDDGRTTRVHLHFRSKMRLPAFIRRRMLKTMLAAFRLEDSLVKLEELARSEQAGLRVDAPAPVSA